MRPYMFRTSGRYSLLPIVLLVLLSQGCKDILEEDISGMTVGIVTPPDSLVSTANTHNFSWDENEDAIDYRLQIMSPDFVNPVEFTLDTVTEETSIYLTLNPGAYSWRVRAQNASSVTEWTTQTLFIDTTSSLQGQTLILNSPVDGLITGIADLTFQWQSIDDANNYTWQLYESDNGNVGAAYGNPESTSSTSIDLTLPEGHWWWRMVASNWTSLSDFSQRQITVDQTPPTIATLSYPDGQLFASDSTISFLWNQGIDVLTEVNDSLFIWNDQDQLMLSEQVNNEAFEYSLSTLLAGTYEWEILSYDEAGNWILSDISTFEIQ